jgi:hypothetical protein
MSINFHRLSQISRTWSDFCWKSAPIKAIALAFTVFGNHRNSPDFSSRIFKILPVSKFRI